MRLSVDIPVLETERLRLREPRPGDADAYAAFIASDRSRFLGGLDEADASLGWECFAAEIGHWFLRGYGMWAVTLRGSDQSLGYVGCWHPDGHPEPEIGWLLWPEAEGRGIAQEAALAARGHAYGALGWPTAVSYVSPDNARSIRLAERLGCTLDADAPRPSADDLVYRHPAPEAAQ